MIIEENILKNENEEDFENEDEEENYEDEKNEDYEEDLKVSNDDKDIEEEDFEDDIEDIEDNNSNNKIIVKKTEKKTFNFLTKYEKNYIIGFRIQQIANGSPIFIDIDPNSKFDIFKIATQELLEKKLPFKLKRKLPNGNIELWDLDDLIIF